MFIINDILYGNDFSPAFLDAGLAYFGNNFSDVNVWLGI
jgi:hypothetical protein